MSALSQLRDRPPVTWETIVEGVSRIHLPRRIHQCSRRMP